MLVRDGSQGVPGIRLLELQQLGRGSANVKLIKLLAIALLPLFPLVGCAERVGGGPNSVSQSGRELLIAVCESIDVTEITGSIYTDSGRHSFLDLAGSARIEAGTILHAGPLEGLAGQYDPVDPSTIQGIDVHFEGTGKGASWLSSFDTNGSEGIPSDGWLQTDGSVTEDGCPGS